MSDNIIAQATVLHTLSTYSCNEKRIETHLISRAPHNARNSVSFLPRRFARSKSKRVFITREWVANKAALLERENRRAFTILVSIRLA